MGRLPLASVALSLLVSAPAVAQGGALSGASLDVSASEERRGEWLDAVYTGRREGSLREVTRVIDGRRERAWIGRAAIVELATASALTSHEIARVTPLSTRPALFRVESARDDEDGLSLARRLADAGVVRAAMPDLHLARRLAAIDVPPNDPEYGGQWYLDTIGIEDAWAIETGDPEVSIVVVDNGCEMTHPDLVDAYLGGRDVRDMDDDPSPLFDEGGGEHGTACSGLVAGVGDNGLGIAGTCPECTLYCVRLLGPTGALTEVSADIAAFEYARSVGARVVSNSWGFIDAISIPSMLRDVMEALYDEGVLVVFAAGNDARALEGFEITNVRGVVTVGALNLFDEVAPFSNFGDSLDLTAPTGTLSTDLTGVFGESSGDYTSLFGGTSSSCPIVAGVAGLLFSADPSLTAVEVHDALVQTTRPAPFAVPDEVGHDPHHGFGIVNPAAALRRVTGMPEPDAGPPPATDAGVAGADAGTPAPPDGGCGCRASGRSSAPGWILALAFIGFMLGRRRVQEREELARAARQ